jgi:hypothetical protein
MTDRELRSDLPDPVIVRQDWPTDRVPVEDAGDEDKDD